MHVNLRQSVMSGNPATGRLFQLVVTGRKDGPVPRRVKVVRAMDTITETELAEAVKSAPLLEDDFGAALIAAMRPE